MCLNCSRRFPIARAARMKLANVPEIAKSDTCRSKHKKSSRKARHRMLRSRLLGPQPRKNSGSHIDASHSRQPLVKGERLVRYEVNAVMTLLFATQSAAIHGVKAACASAPAQAPVVARAAAQAAHAKQFRVRVCVCRSHCSRPRSHSNTELNIAYVVGSRSQAGCLQRNFAMDDSIGGS